MSSFRILFYAALAVTEVLAQTPTAEDRILSSRPGVFGPPPTAGEFAGSRAEGEQLYERMLARLPFMRRLPPSSFPELPIPVARELERRGCTIPQTPRPQPHNVIHGEFARPGQQDWALLCSTRDPRDTGAYGGYTTRLLVFWNGSPENPAVFESFPDGKFMQGSETALFSVRLLAVATRDYILDHDRAYGQEKGVILPSPLDHQGVEDIFDGKASTIQYFFQNKWLQLSGAD
jgi:hypothetical protein